MKPFEQLTDRGKARRLMPLAREALTAWPIEVRRVRLIAVSVNVLFRVDTTDGRRYALRVFTPHELHLPQAAAEMLWLDHLAAEAPELGAPWQVPARDGRRQVTASAPGVPEPRVCQLLTWVPGRMLGNDPSRDDYRRLGALMARMHLIAERFPIPEGFGALRWDRVCYFSRDWEAAFDPAYDHLFDADTRAMLRRATARCSATLAKVAAMPGPMIMHGDLHPWNVHRVRDRLIPLDFADLTVGQPIQDVAISLFYLTKHADYPGLCAAFEEGYSALRPWPAADRETVETLKKSRSLNFVHFVALFVPSEHHSLPARCASLAEWIDG